MADGVVHEKYNFNFLYISLFITIGLIIASLSNLIVINLFLACSPLIGAIGGLLSTPDSDLVSIEYTRIGRLSYVFFHSIQLSELINKLHTIIWAIYIVAMPHRSFFSHSLFLSTLIRIIYILLIWFVPVYFIYNINLVMYINIIQNHILTYPFEYGIIYIFWFIQDAIHLYLDDIWIYPKKKPKTIKKGIHK